MNRADAPTLHVFLTSIVTLVTIATIAVVFAGRNFMVARFESRAS